MNFDTAFAKTIRDAMDAGVRTGMLQCADLLMETSQVRGLTPEQARGYLDAAKLISEFHASLFPTKVD